MLRSPLGGNPLSGEFDARAMYRTVRLVLLASLVGMVTSANVATASSVDEPELMSRLATARSAIKEGLIDQAETACQDAKAITAQRELDDFTIGAIANCFADVASIKNDRVSACTGYGHAISYLTRERQRDRNRSSVSNIVQ
jgi:hypothetical protein